MIEVRPLRVPVTSGSDVPVARELAVRSGAELGLRSARLDAVAVVAGELAANLHRHAIGGELLLLPPAPFSSESSLGLVAVDRGPGVDHFERCLVDGYSTIGTLGTGLGAVRRMSDEFDALSEAGVGTVVRAGFHVGTPTGRSGVSETEGRTDIVRDFRIGSAGFPVGDELDNGDAWTVARRGSRLIVLLADGLGHGPKAAEASADAARTFRAAIDDRPTGIVNEISRRLTSSRGAAIAVASIELDMAREGGVVLTSGLGNVSILSLGRDGSTKRIATPSGTAGVRSRTSTAEQRSPFPPRGLLVLHTDGLSSRWTCERRVELLRHSPEVIAAALWRDHCRHSDDSMIVVVEAAVDRP